MWTTEQVLEFLGISRPTLRRMMRASESDAHRPWVRIGNRFRWSSEPAEIQEWVHRMESR
jgi:excisionase family DNA binding protein